MSNVIPPCRTVEVRVFRGDRSRAFVAAFLAALDDARHGRGPGPTSIDCLLYLGHAGISIDGGLTVYGFHPEVGGVPAWQVLDRLNQGDAFPGAVRDDTGLFAAARRRPLAITSIDVVLPEPVFQNLQARLDAERRTSHYLYSFPDGDGDCNCITWLERLGLPLLTGYIDEFIAVRGIFFLPSRRFGRCL